MAWSAFPNPALYIASMEDNSSPFSPRRRWSFGLKTMFVPGTLLGIILGAVIYWNRPPTVNLDVTADDLAWATDTMIWKIDLSNAGEVYGLRMVVFEDEGRTKTTLCQIFGGEEPMINPRRWPLARIVIQKSGQDVIGKLDFSGSGTTFEIGNFFDTQTTSRHNRPDRKTDFYPLLSNDSGTFSGTRFPKGSKTLALELLTKPIQF